MKTIFLFAALVATFINCEAQSLQNDKAVTYFYTVNLDDDISRIVSSPILKAVDNDTDSVDFQVNKELVADIADTFYIITLKKFKNDLGLELLPLNALHGQVKYNSKHPNCPDVASIKKVLKSTSGYKYYADYYVNVYSDLSIYSHDDIPSPTGIKPLYAISLTIYDNTGKQLKKINLCYKSKKALIESTKSEEQVKSKLCNLYCEALNQVALEYKRTVAEL